MFIMRVGCCVLLSCRVTATMLGISMCMGSYECAGSIVLLRYIAARGGWFSMALASISVQE